MAKFYGYGRHSTKQQGMTRDVQEKQLIAYWKAMLEPEGVEWGGFFYDKATSGGTPMTERAQGRQLWAIAQKGDHIGWAKLDRAFRSVRDGVTQMHLFRQKGVFTHSVDLRMDTSTPMGEFVLHVLMAFAQLEHQYASLRTREVMARMRETHHPKFAPPIGWKTKFIDGRRELVVDSDERKAVARFYRMYQDGHSQEDILLQMQREGLKRGKYDWSCRQVRRAFVALEHGFPKDPPAVRFKSRSRSHRRNRSVVPEVS